MAKDPGVVFTQLNQPRVATARTHPSFNELRRIFVSTIKVLGAGVIIALISSVSSSSEIMAVLSVSIAAAALLRVARCVWVLEAVIKAPLEQ